MTFPIVLNEANVHACSPANRSGTFNRRIISAGTVGAAHLEALVGTISKHNGAHRHAHPNLEQASIILSGAGVSEVGNASYDTAAGDWAFYPQGTVTSS